MKISVIKRTFTAYKIIGNNFKIWVSPIMTAIILLSLKSIVFITMILDKIVYPKVNSYKISKPIIIVGNPRSGTTFLHRYLIKSKIGSGGELWKLLYPSIVLQKLVKPFLPILEKISPTRHHSTVAHKTSLQSIETDDASIFFVFLMDFSYTVLLCLGQKKDLFHWFDPKIRDTSKRDYSWLYSIWSRILIDSKMIDTLENYFQLAQMFLGF